MVLFIVGQVLNPTQENAAGWIGSHYITNNRQNHHSSQNQVTGPGCITDTDPRFVRRMRLADVYKKPPIESMW